MTLMCECGSLALSFEEQAYPEDAPAYERYRCESCGRTGSYSFGSEGGEKFEQMTGCLTTEYE